MTFQHIMPHIWLGIILIKSFETYKDWSGTDNKHRDKKRVSDHLNKVPHVGIEWELHRGTVTTATRQNKTDVNKKINQKTTWFWT